MIYTEYFFELHILVDELDKRCFLMVVDFPKKRRIRRDSIMGNQISI
jgi:hypothetical protein